MELEIQKPQTVNAKTLKIHLKVSDCFTAQLVSDKGEQIHNQSDGYVPSFMPGNHYGDYVILDIDVDTGVVTNWKKLTAGDIQGIGSRNQVKHDPRFTIRESAMFRRKS